MTVEDDNPSPPFDQPGFEASLTDSIPDMPEAMPAQPASGSSISAASGPMADGSSPMRDAAERSDGTKVARPGWVGKMLGRFRLMRLLGEGTMGRVIQAEDVHLHRLVALKVLRTQIRGMDEQERVDHFLREARAVAQLDHPNVVRIFEINEHQGWWYIAMEMLGQTLREVVQTVGPLVPAKACAIVADAAEGLAAAHAAGIIHRDIKPNNLMMSRSGRCKLTDFGLVHFEEPDDPFARDTKSVGTPQYMAPEAIRRLQPTAATDVYSLGATLYFALTGKPPFDTGNVREALRHHLATPPPDVAAVVTGVPPSLAAFIQRAMDKEPANRPTAAEFAAAMRLELIGQPGVDAGSSMFGAAPGLGPVRGGPQPVMHRGQWLLVIATGLIAAVVGSAVYVAMMSPRDKRPPTPAKPVGPATLTAGQLFPTGPPSYGLRAAGEWPTATPATVVPPFSWKLGKHDVAGRQFIASKRGRYYYTVDDPRNALIRDEDFLAFTTEAEARDSGRIRAP